jgi:hypothetical protein
MHLPCGSVACYPPVNIPSPHLCDVTCPVCLYLPPGRPRHYAQPRASLLSASPRLVWVLSSHCNWRRRTCPDGGSVWSDLIHMCPFTARALHSVAGLTNCFSSLSLRVCCLPLASALYTCRPPPSPGWESCQRTWRCMHAHWRMCRPHPTSRPPSARVSYRTYLHGHLSLHGNKPCL